MTQKIVDPKLCPLCGESNRCGRVVDEAAASCWCMEVAFSDELLSQVSEESRLKACVCRKCVDSSQESVRENS